jgi:hypothetical protein
LHKLKIIWNIAPLQKTWLCSDDLGLAGELAAEWDLYRRALIGAGATIRDTEDKLMWTGGNSSGTISVKNAYLALISTKKFLILGGWRHNIWKWDLQLKIKLFIWLAVEQKILTWDILQQKGWEGPSLCILCKRSSEDINHLFLECTFTKLVWERIKIIQKIKRNWEGYYTI